MRQRNPAYTLAELLVALALLGIIATFTITKLVESKEEADRNNVHKEVYGMLSELLRKGMLKGEIDGDRTGETFSDYVLQNAKYVKACVYDQSSGCTADYSYTPIVPGAANPAVGIFLSNGAVIKSLDGDYCTSNHVLCPNNDIDMDYIHVDWNGTASPNTYNQDIIVYEVYYGTDNGDEGQEPGQITTGSGGIYDEMFFGD